MTEKNTNKTSDVSELIISNPLGDQIELTKVSHDSINYEKEYKEIFIGNASMLFGNVAQGGLQIANQAMTVSKIASQFPNGIFTATASPSTLSKFTNGTTSTMVRDAQNNLVKHAGFTEVGLSSTLNPAMVISAGMQAMAMVSGTYYLKQINSQIKEIDANLEELLSIHHDEKLGKLIAARKGLSEIAAREFVDMADVNAIRNFKQSADEVFEEYFYGLHRKEKKLVNAKKHIDSKLSDINFYMSVAFEASKLSLFAELIEIGTRMKIGGQTQVIQGLTQQIEVNYKNSFYFNIEKEAEEFYQIVKDKNDKYNSKKKNENEMLSNIANGIPVWAEGIGILAKVGFMATASIKTNVDINAAKSKEKNRQNKLAAVKNQATQNRELETIDETIESMIEFPKQDVEVLYVLDDGTQRAFIPIRNKEVNFVMV